MQHPRACRDCSVQSAPCRSGGACRAATSPKRTGNPGRRPPSDREVLRLHPLLKTVGPGEIFVRIAFENFVISGYCLAQLRHADCSFFFQYYTLCKKSEGEAALIASMS